MKTKTLGLLIVAVVVVVAALLAFSSRDTSSTRGDKVFNGKVIPPASFSVADYKGKPLVVNFFGSWCEYCKLEANDLARFAQVNPDAQVVGIASQDTEHNAKAFMAAYDMDYPLVVDDGSLTAEYGINGWPTTIFFNVAGKEVDRLVGASDFGQFTASLSQAQ